MKTITLKNTGNLPQTLYVSEETPPTQPTRQVTINHLTTDNPRWPRNIQLSNEFIFVKRAGCPTVGMHVDDFIALCTRAEPSISWPPIFIKHVIAQGSPATVEAQFNPTNPELSETDNKIAYQWQSGDNRTVLWNDLQDNEVFSGCTTSKLSIVNKPGDSAIVLRCIATNSAGSRASSPVTNVPPPMSAPVSIAKPVTPIAPVNQSEAVTK